MHIKKVLIMELQLHICLVEQSLGEYKALLDFIKMSFAHARLQKKKCTFARRD
jgi:hypothetical protein